MRFRRIRFWLLKFEVEHKHSVAIANVSSEITETHVFNLQPPLKLELEYGVQFVQSPINADPKESLVAVMNKKLKNQQEEG